MQDRIEDARPRRHRAGCLARTLISLVLLLAILLGVWFLAVRPYLSNMAQTKLNAVLDNAVNQIPPQVTQAPDGQPFAVQERVLNNLLVLESSPNDVVKNTQVHITTSAMRMDFQINGFSSTVTGVPQVQNGQIVMTNITVEGLAALILTSDEIQALANRHLADAQRKLNHSIVSVQLKDHEMDMVLGPASGSSPTSP